MIGKAETVLDVLEAGLTAGAQSRAGEDDAWDAIEQVPAQDRADFDRRAGQAQLLATVACPLHPVDLVGELLAQPALQPIGEVLTAEAGGLVFDLLFGIVDLVADAV